MVQRSMALMSLAVQGTRCWHLCPCADTNDTNEARITMPRDMTGAWQSVAALAGPYRPQWGAAGCPLCRWRQ